MSVSVIFESTSGGGCIIPFWDRPSVEEAIAEARRLRYYGRVAWFGDKQNLVYKKYGSGAYVYVYDLVAGGAVVGFFLIPNARNGGLREVV